MHIDGYFQDAMYDNMLSLSCYVFWMLKFQRDHLFYLDMTII